MARHRAKRNQPYPLLWQVRYYRNQWLHFWKPALKKALRAK